MVLIYLLLAVVVDLIAAMEEMEVLAVVVDFIRLLNIVSQMADMHIMEEGEEEVQQ